MEKLLQSKGFSLNTYPEGKFWELTVEEDEWLKVKICKIFNAEIEVTVNGSDVETLICNVQKILRNVFSIMTAIRLIWIQMIL